MCGICGQYHLNGAEPAVVERMASVLAHRGPDGCGIYHDDLLTLGATRLAIIDIAAGSQPVFNEDQQIVVVFNGEVYNHRALRTELEAQGHHFATHTDTEVLAHGYEAWGMGLVDRLNGMFAFAIWDKVHARLLLARDRLGEKPLYYTRTRDGFLFASEVKALFQESSVPRAVNADALPTYLTLGHVPGPATLFRGIYKLAPGEFMVIEKGESRTGRFWQPVMNTTAPDLDYDGAVRRVRELLTEAVAMRLMSDVPVGALFSGGLDSAAIVAVASTVIDRPIATFTVAFDFEPGSKADEKFNVDSAFAGLMAARYKTDHHVLTVEQSPRLSELLPHLIYAMDEPIAQPSIILSACVAALARKNGVPVLLTGDGGDELFAGYPAYRMDRILERYLQVPELLRKSVLNPILEQVPWKLGQQLVKKSRSVAPVDRYLNWQRIIGLDALPGLLSDAALAQQARSRVSAVLEPLLAAPQTHHFADRIAFTGLSTWLAEDSNMRVDKMNMAMSIEARAPLEDHRLVTFAFGLPLEYKLRSGDYKRVFKDAVRDLLPPEILTRPKWGFVPPSSEWLRTVFNSLVQRYLSPENVKAVGWFNPDTVSNLIHRHITKQGYELWSLWTLLNFHIWHALYIEQSLVLDYQLTPDAVLSLVAKT